MRPIIEHWDEESGVSRCILSYQTSSGVLLQGIGIAECHPDDYDFMSQLTGSIIAGYRAEIDLIKKINNYEIKPGIAALKHVYCTMIHSKKYNEKSYEAIRLKKEIAHLMDELEENNQSIKVGQNELKNFIDKKEELYKKLRKDKNKQEIN